MFVVVAVIWDEDNLEPEWESPKANALLWGSDQTGRPLLNDGHDGKVAHRTDARGHEILG